MTQPEIVARLKQVVEANYPLLEIELERHCVGVCGESSYVTIWGRKYSRWLNLSIRISDHSVGVQRINEHYHIYSKSTNDETEVSLMNLCYMLSSGYNALINESLGIIPKTKAFAGWTNAYYAEYANAKCSPKIKMAAGQVAE